MGKGQQRRDLRPARGRRANGNPYLDLSDGAPGTRREGERALWAVEPARELVAKRRLTLRLEGGRVRPGWADAGRKRLPEVVEVVVRGLHDERRHADLREARARPELAELAGRREAHRGSLVGRFGIERGGRIPEAPEHRHLAAVVPDAAGDDTAGSRDPNHLAQSLVGIGEEVDDEL